MLYPLIIPFGMEGGVQVIFTDDELLNLMATSIGAVLGTKKRQITC